MVTFADALRSVPSNQKKHVLLGNGFSQAWKREIFSYGSLLEKANFSKLSTNARKVFDTLSTTDFEIVIRTLKDAAKIVRLYSDTQKTLISELNSDAKKLKALLVETISQHHPADPSEVTEEQFQTCRAFLRHFDRIYTINYDLLLYWVLMHETFEESPADKIFCDDGFRHPDGEDDSAPYVSWEIDRSNCQNIFYLHGALHLFQSETELQKFTWTRTGIKLMTQTNEALDQGLYPLIVAEGTSDQKMARITRSSYLHRGLKSLASIKGTLFIFGMSLSDNDAHILKFIQRSKVSNLWVGIYGDVGLPANRKLMSIAQGLAELRSKRNPLTVNFYDSSTAQVWAS